MQRFRTTALLWLVLCATVPVPFFMIEHGVAPVVRLWMFAAVTTRAAYHDPDYASRFIAGLFLVQSLLYGGALAWLARVIVRAGARRFPRGITTLVVVLALALVVLSLRFDLYLLPLARGGMRANLLGIFG